MTDSPDTFHRFTRDERCPACHGYGDAGSAERCTGGVWADKPGRYLCSNVASDRETHRGGLWWHSAESGEAPDVSRMAASKATAQADGPKPGHAQATYDYATADGDHAFYVQRFDHPTRGKQFRPVHYDERGHPRFGLPEAFTPETAPLYRAPELASGIAHGEPIYLLEGEKDVETFYSLRPGPGVVATSRAFGAPVSGMPAAQAEQLRGAAEVRIVADRDDAGRAYALATSGALARLGVPATVVEAAVNKPGADFSDHVEMLLSGAEALDFALALERLQPLAGDRPASKTAEDAVHEFRALVKASADRMRHYLDEAPKPVEWIFERFAPAGVEGAIVGAGGSGKGTLSVSAGLHLAVGEDFGPLKVPKPRGVVFVSVEDSDEELHRRIAAAIDFHFGDRPDLEDLRERIARNVRPVAARGVGVALSPAFVDALAQELDLEDPGLIVFDPLSRLSGPDVDLNSQGGAGALLAQVGRLSQRTRATVAFVHHISKAAARGGLALDVTAATGSQQLVDLARFAVNLAPMTDARARDLGLDPAKHWTEVRQTKSNAEPWPSDRPLALELAPHYGVAVADLVEATAPEPRFAETVFDVIETLQRTTDGPIRKEAIDEACRERGLSKRDAEAGRRELRRLRAIAESRADGFTVAPNGRAVLDAFLRGEAGGKAEDYAPM